MKDGIDLIVYDFDGVLTDNRVLVRQDGMESVSCTRSDGWWIARLREAGYEQVILSTEENPVVAARARKLGIPAIHGQTDKGAALRALLADRGVTAERTCYVGNDVNDRECMTIAGHPVAPMDAAPDILALARRRLPVRGGHGVCRELARWLLGEGAVRGGRPPDTGSLEWMQRRVRTAVGRWERLVEEPGRLAPLAELCDETVRALGGGGKLLLAADEAARPDAARLVERLGRCVPDDLAPVAALMLGRADGCGPGVVAREVRSFAREGDVFLGVAITAEADGVTAAALGATERGLPAFLFVAEEPAGLPPECRVLVWPGGVDGAREAMALLLPGAAARIEESLESAGVGP